MDFLEKINSLMSSNNLNKSTLSKACDIPYTTVDGWYKRGYEGLKLPTLKKLSNYFDISLDFWADDEIIDPIPQKNNNLAISKKEFEFLKSYHNLDSEVQCIITQLIDYENQKSNSFDSSENQARLLAAKRRMEETGGTVHDLIELKDHDSEL